MTNDEKIALSRRAERFLTGATDEELAAHRALCVKLVGTVAATKAFAEEHRRACEAEQRLMGELQMSRQRAEVCVELLGELLAEDKGNQAEPEGQTEASAAPAALRVARQG